MDFLIYAFVYGLVWLLSWLPLPVLYVLSDFFAFLTWYIIPYRKKLVLRNLSRSFPGYEKKQISKIGKRAFHHFCDSFIESLAAWHMPLSKLREHYRYINPELLDELHASGRDIVLIMGHYGNWEWLSTLPLFTRYTILAIYKPLNNKYFDRFFFRLRSKHGVIPVSKARTLRSINRYKQEGKPVMIYFLADQRPRWVQIQHWLTFMNQDTPVVLGPEKIAHKFGMAVVFYKPVKISRGHYENTFVPLVPDPEGTRSCEIIETYYRELERLIREKPEYYLWTHNRWKHRREGVPGKTSKIPAGNSIGYPYAGNNQELT